MSDILKDFDAFKKNSKKWRLLFKSGEAFIKITRLLKNILREVEVLFRNVILLYR
jgi:hypothetical protein